MKKIIILLLLLLLVGCGDRNKNVVPENLLGTDKKDSIIAVMKKNDSASMNSLRTAYTKFDSIKSLKDTFENKLYLAKRRLQQIQADANIATKNPKDREFILGWVNRDLNGWKNELKISK